jgi:hypothetical protein
MLNEALAWLTRAEHVTSMGACRKYHRPVHPRAGYPASLRRGIVFEAPLAMTRQEEVSLWRP